MASSSAPTSANRKLNTLETRLHQSSLLTGRPLTQEEIDALAPDAHARTNAINFLLAAGLLKLMRDPNGNLSYRGVQKNELDAKKGLSGEEIMVLGHIQVAANQGIWTKHLKAKTELHQTVIDRCLKSLVQKQLIKSVKGVKYPTRKIYMMAHLEPSVELTGGPWYTDNELDTEFIKLLCSACLRYIRERTLPKHRHDDSRPSSQPLYPASAGISYPNAKEVLIFLSKSRITETQFTEEHVEMLLNVLVLDGDVERLPAFGSSMWADNDLSDDASQNSSATDSGGVLRKGRRARKKQAAGGVTTTSSENEDDRPRKKSSKKAQSSRDKRKKRKRDPEDMVTSDGGSDGDTNVKRRRKQKTDDDRGEDEDGHKLKRIPSTSKRRSGGGSKVSEPDSQSVTGSSPSDSNSDEESKSTRLISNSRKSTMSSQPKKKAHARSRSPLASLDDKVLRGAYVYRAVRQERVALGWSEAPCGSCPVFDFCNEGGPVGPSGCEYYGEWLKRATITMDS